jgi:hypothetical protein
MSNSAVLIRPQEDVAESGWIELDELDEALFDFSSSVESDEEFTEMEIPIARFASQDEMRFGPRTYTPEQAEVIHLALRQRRSLPGDPLPFDD